MEPESVCYSRWTNVEYKGMIVYILYNFPSPHKILGYKMSQRTYYSESLLQYISMNLRRKHPVMLPVWALTGMGVTPSDCMTPPIHLKHQIGLRIGSAVTQWCYCTGHWSVSGAAKPGEWERPYAAKWNISLCLVGAKGPSRPHTPHQGTAHLVDHPSPLLAITLALLSTIKYIIGFIVSK